MNHSFLFCVFQNFRKRTVVWRQAMFEVKESPKINKGHNCGEGNEYVNGQMDG